MKAKLGQMVLGASVIALGILGLQETAVPKQGQVGQSARAMEALILGQERKPELTLDLDVYGGERRWLYGMYHSAIGHPPGPQRQRALGELVEAALAADDFNMALLAAQQVPSERVRSSLLGQIVDRAIATSSQLEYAALAVTMIPSVQGQKAAMDRLVNAYVELLYRSGGKHPGEKLEL
ncbi:hypothetical protein FCL40_09365 [Ferrimonas sediminicola]|uniref:Uncharacterized protein n=1 Tax=Ferrimonas sediminicola TaxID=2569538 RepID=A0A4U1BCW4_9GAMM|nr:hypothetical protein [Ferrimonas sediminicola]TKB48842.1 hypothetical protein FCL40_09365 [Ferrimonas sediminicola]